MKRSLKILKVSRRRLKGIRERSREPGLTALLIVEVSLMSAIAAGAASVADNENIIANRVFFDIDSFQRLSVCKPSRQALSVRTVHA